MEYVAYSIKVIIKGIIMMTVKMGIALACGLIILGLIQYTVYVISNKRISIYNEIKRKIKKDLKKIKKKY